MNNILVTGSTSMIGRQTLSALVKNGFNAVPLPRAYDLTYGNWATEFKNIDCIIHLAGYNGGIAYNDQYPLNIFDKTVRMGLNVISLAIKNNINKIIFIVPSCALAPSQEQVDESAFYRGRPHKSVACHGMAKRTVAEAGLHWAKQYGGKFVTVIGQNSFGPHDNFEESGKVVSGLISKIVKAKKDNLPETVIWGTGSPLREFIYCKDMANGLVEVLKKYEEDYPIILNSGYEISILDLAYKISKIVGYEGMIVCDTSKPDGQMRKSMSTKRMKEFLNVEITDFDIALQETVDWFLEKVKNEQPISNS